MADNNQNLVQFRLIGTLSVSGTTVNVSNDILRDTAINVEDASITIQNEGGTTFELVKATITAGVLTTSKRGITEDQTLTEDATLKREWRPGAIGFITSFASDIVDKETGQSAVYANATARDTAIPSPSNGMQVYLTDEGYFTDYVGGAWTARASGSTPNASETVAGKVEAGTTAQSKAGTDTGETGALTFVSPSDIAKNIQSGTFVYGTDVGGDDTYVVALTPVLASYTAGQRLTFTPTTENTGACSVDFGPSVLNIKTKDGNDPQTGVLRALTPITGIYDGTNFVIDNEDFGTTSNKGIFEMSDDTEATTGTSETLIPNVKQMKDNYYMIYTNGTGTMLSQTSITISVFNHSHGKIPRKIKFTVSLGGVLQGTGVLSGGVSVFFSVNGSIGLNGTGYIHYTSSQFNISISNVTSTQFTLTTPNNSSSTYTYFFLYEME